jgi:hypothetical protein
MKAKRLLIGIVAIGLLALSGWKAFSHFKKAPLTEAVAQHWVCPMRCLGKVYDHAGECVVCHMKLVPVEQPQGALLGYSCPLHYSQKIFDKPGKCPFCSLELKPVYSGAKPAALKHAHINPWEELEGKTAVYFRPYTVQKLQPDTLFRVAGRLRGTRLNAALPAGAAKRLKAGMSAMIMPPQGYSRPAFGSLESVGPGDKAVIRSPRAFPGVDYALAEIRVPAAPSLAVPTEAISESDGHATVFLKRGDAYIPWAVSVTARGESYASVSGLAEGDVVAGSGVFWLEAQWRMDHGGGLN